MGNGAISVLKHTTSSKGVLKITEEKPRKTPEGLLFKKAVKRVVLFHTIEEQMKEDMVSKAMETIKPLHSSIQ